MPLLHFFHRQFRPSSCRNTAFFLQCLINGTKTDDRSTGRHSQARSPFRIALAALILLAPLPAAASDVVGWGRQVILNQEDVESIDTIAAGGSFNVGIREDGQIVVWGANNFRQAVIPEGIESPRSLAAGYSHILALMDDGTVIAWGDNRHGQASPPRNLRSVEAIAAGRHHSLALLADGSVVGWGSDENGQLEIPENLSEVRSLAAGESHSLALLADGTVSAWGSGDAAALPDDLPPLQKVVAGDRHNLGLTDDGQVIAWGADDYGQASVPRGLRGIASIAAGADHSIAIRDNGAVLAWGRDDFGQGEVPRGIGAANAIAAGDHHNLVLGDDGLFAWGRNDQAQSLTPGDLEGAAQVSSQGNLGIVLREDGSIVTWGADPDPDENIDPDELTDVVSVAAGGRHFLALREDGTVAAWGDNTFRQTENVDVLENIIAIAAGEYHSLALQDDGQVVSWGSIIDAQQVPEGLQNVIAIDAGPFHSLALRSDGTVHAWGNNFYGEASVPPDLENVTAVAAGDFHSLALHRDGTVSAWGNNFFGQASPPPGLDSVSAIASGATHNLALRGDGSIIAWGSDFYGQTSVRENLRNIVALAAGASRSLAISGDPTPPRVFAQTGAQVADAGETVIFNVFATGSPPLQFQWTQDDELIPDADGQSLILENVSSDDAGEYKALIASPTGNVVSDLFSLEIRDPAIARHPDSREVRLGGHVILRAAAEGTEPFEYQWKLDGEPVSGATEDTLEIQNVQVEDTGTYTVEVSNEHGNVESQPARVIATPQFASQPPEIVPAVPGESVTIAVEAVGTPPLQYQWEYEGEILPEATEPELEIPQVRLEHAGSYRVTVWNDAGHTTSDEGQLLISPVIASHPQSQVLPLGGTAIFEVRAIGSEPMEYRWYQNETVIQEGQSNQLIRDEIEPRDGGVYTVEVRNPSGTQTSQEARLVAPPGLVSHPESQEVQAGETVRLSVEAIGAEPIRFQWEKDGEPIPGATSSTLTLENTRGEDSGSYRVRIRNEAGEVTSRTAILRLAPAIVSGPEPVTTTPGRRVTFEVHAEGSPPLSYQWMKDGVPVENAQEPMLEIPAVDENDVGRYTVMVSNSAGIQLSSPAELSLDAED